MKVNIAELENYVKNIGPYKCQMDNYEVMALIRVAKAAIEYVNAPRFNTDETAYKIKDECYIELTEALKEIAP